MYGQPVLILQIYVCMGKLHTVLMDFMDFTPVVSCHPDERACCMPAVDCN
jgi:hypothetical protein